MSTYILLQLNTPSDVIQLATFLADRNIHSHVMTHEEQFDPYHFKPSYEATQTLLEATVQQNPNVKPLLQRTVFGPWVSNLTAEDMSLKIMRKPTKEFQHFCGSEWLSPKGEISLQLARERVILHANAKNLLVGQKVLVLDEVLQSLFHTSDAKMYLDELTLRIQEALFESKE